MKLFIVKIKEGGESEKNHSLCVETETYGSAEKVGYKWAEENIGTVLSMDVVKTQIKEFINKDQTGFRDFFFLVKYEFGLEAKPEKSNLIVPADDILRAVELATEYLKDKCDGLFIPEAKKQDIDEFIDFDTVKALTEADILEEDFSL
jgi:hypothetical protein